MKNADAQPDILSVWMNDTLVGTLYNENPLAFMYDPAWLASILARPLNPEIGLQAGKITTPFVHAFFENLLPEGDQRKLVSLREHVNSVFGLLSAVGGDTAGSIVLLPPDQIPEAPRYRSLSWSQVGQMMHGGLSVSLRKSLDRQEAVSKSRFSISGAQYKILLSLDPKGAPMIPLGASPSTHILKPDIVRAGPGIFASAINETIVMTAAQLCDLPTAQVSYQTDVKACLVRRYDRIPSVNNTLQRIWQADFCQLTGTPSEVKYESDGGPSFKSCFDLLRVHSVQPAVDQRNLLRWLFFNLYVGNNDSHAKNLSLLSAPEGMRLAPFYDLMSTRVYTGLAPHFAFQIGGEYVPGKIKLQQLETLAQSIGVGSSFLKNTAAEMAEQVQSAIVLATEQVGSGLGPAEQIMSERLLLNISSIVKKMRKGFE